MSNMWSQTLAIRPRQCLRAASHTFQRPTLPPSTRPFSTTQAIQARSTKDALRRQHEKTPIYPHGPAKWYKKSNFGLFGGKRVQFGNIVSGKRWIKKTRRKWWPNIRDEKLYSEALGKSLRLRISASALRTVDKIGGLDNYVLGNKSARIKELGMKGWQLRWRVLQTQHMQQKLRQQREEIGLSEKSPTVKKTKVLSQEFMTKYIQKLPTAEEKKAKRLNNRSRHDIWSKASLREVMANERRHNLKASTQRHRRSEADFEEQ